ncbi:MAG: MFS transporter [Pseudomonadota bacterium]
MGSIINVALPVMRADLSTDAAGAQWIVNAYLLPLGALVLVGGALGDHYGRKRLFLIGLATFTLATLGAALSPTLLPLLAARALQGVGAALLAPNSLAIIADAFSGEARAKAVGTWAAAGAIAEAAAPVLGGWIIDVAGWRWAFGIVVPPALIGAVVAWRSIGESTADGAEAAPLDLSGAALISLALAALVWALISFPDRGMGDPAVLAAFIGGAVLSLAFLTVEARKGDAAMLPLGVFGSRSFSGISLLTLFLYGALGGLLVLLPWVLIERFGYSAKQAGAAILPFPLLMGILSRSAGPMALKIGIRRTLTFGPLLVAAGFALFALTTREAAGYWTGIFPALVTIALGMAASVAPLTTAVMNSVEDRYVGVASGVNNAISRTAGLIATAFLGFVLAGSADGGADLLPGFRAAAGFGAALAAGGALLAFLMIREDAVRDGAA